MARVVTVRAVIAVWTTLLVTSRVSASIGFSPACSQHFVNHDPAFPHQVTTHTELCRDGYYAISYDNDMKNPAFSAYAVTKAQANNVTGDRSHFVLDPDLRAQSIPQASSGSSEAYNTTWNMGHLAPSNLFSWSEASMKATFKMSNTAPQYFSFNQIAWRLLEADVLEWIQANSTLHIITGVAYEDRSQTPKSTDGVAFPQYYFKVLCDTAAGVSVGFVGSNDATGEGTTKMRCVKDIEGLYGGQLFPEDTCQTAAVSASHWFSGYEVATCEHGLIGHSFNPLSNETTTAAATTTAAPPTTTAAPITTTAAATTTAAPTTATPATTAAAETTTAAPTTSEPTTMAPTTTTMAPNITTSAPVTTTEAPLTPPPSTTSSPNATSLTTTMAPVGPEDLVAYVVLFRIAGDGFSVILASAESRLRLVLALTNDLAALLGIDTRFVVIRNLSVGSLIVDAQVNANDTATNTNVPDNITATSIAAAVEGSSAWLQNTQSTYRAETGNDTAVLSLTGNVTVQTTVVQQTTAAPNSGATNVTTQSPSGSGPVTTQTPATLTSLGSASFECGTACGIMIAIGLFFIAVVIATVVLMLCCKGSDEGDGQKEAELANEPYPNNAHRV